MSFLKHYLAAFRMLLVLTVLLGIGYPLLVWAVAQAPGLQAHADGSLVSRGGRVVGSSLIGQSFTDKDGAPLTQYFQSRPSAAGNGYDPTASGASNLGPESIVGPHSLLTQVCSRSLAIGKSDGVDGSRPFCSPDGTGSVLAVFWSGPGYAGHITRVVSVNQGPRATPFLRTYRGVRVELARPGEDLAKGQVIAIRGSAPADPAVPADAVTASGSGLDPDISPAYAAIQEARVAAARHISVAQVRALVASYTSGRFLGFLGEPTVNVLKLNLALDKEFPTAA
jgi:K+-transporting ATPase ATPase C chain